MFCVVDDNMDDQSVSHQANDTNDAINEWDEDSSQAREGSWFTFGAILTGAVKEKRSVILVEAVKRFRGSRKEQEMRVGGGRAVAPGRCRDFLRQQSKLDELHRGVNDYQATVVGKLTSAEDQQPYRKQSKVNKPSTLHVDMKYNAVNALKV